MSGKRALLPSIPDIAVTLFSIFHLSEIINTPRRSSNTTDIKQTYIFEEYVPMFHSQAGHSTFTLDGYHGSSASSLLLDKWDYSFLNHNASGTEILLM